MRAHGRVGFAFRHDLSISQRPAGMQATAKRIFATQPVSKFVAPALLQSK